MYKAPCIRSSPPASAAAGAPCPETAARLRRPGRRRLLAVRGLLRLRPRRLPLAGRLVRPGPRQSRRDGLGRMDGQSLLGEHQLCVIPRAKTYRYKNPLIFRAFSDRLVMDMHFNRQFNLILILFYNNVYVKYILMYMFQIYYLGFQ